MIAFAAANVMTAAVLLLLVTLSLTSTLSSSSALPPTVVLDGCNNTTLFGVVANVSSGITAAAVHEYRGIPFAYAPVGARRFKATEDMTCPTSSSSFDASSFGNPCSQVYGDLVVGHEDCLYLNVYVPESLAVARRRQRQRTIDGSVMPPLLAPVLVYIHGGSLVIGSGAFEQLGFLSAFASGDDAVSSADTAVITINYRLALLGFLATASMCDESSERTCGNYGILDQQSALRWVQKHIHSFGGDRRRVGIMGQSSGGTSVFALMGSKRSAGLFSTGISLSGSPNITMCRGEKLQQDEQVASLLGCPSSLPHAAQLACLRNLSASDVQLKMPNSWNLPTQWSNMHLDNASKGGENYIGLVYVDGVVIESPIWPAIASGNVSANVSLLFGNMGQECNLQPPQTNVANLSATEWRDFIGSAIFHSWKNGTTTVVKDIYDLYMNASTINPQLAYDSLNSDYGMSCASYSIAHLLRATARTSKRSAPTYIYVHQQGPSRPALLPSGPMAYAFHTWDYTNACHNWVLYSPTADDLALSALQRSQWFSLWTTGTLMNSTTFGWPDIRSLNEATYFLFSQPSRYPFRGTGATAEPFTTAGLCPYLINTLGMNERYWWCN